MESPVEMNRQRDFYPPGVPCWVDTEQRDPVAATDFYGKLFSWQFDDQLAGTDGPHYFLAKLHGLDVAGVATLAEPGSGQPRWNTYVSVASADDAARRVKDAGGTVLMAPVDVLDAGRVGVFADPEGARFCVWEAREHPGARFVNEPGAWVFSELNTRDVERAQAFYSAVFGWELLTFEMGDSSFTMLTLPGYGDFLEQRDPGLRARVQENGGPPGFADVVAWLIPIAGADVDTPAHWSVTFAVDDADAAATRAAELGGRVVVPPFDAPPVRMTVLADPQGAVLTASRFQPDA
jgi:predicted enzyme related to lactoylglutathione lyase